MTDINAKNSVDSEVKAKLRVLSSVQEKFSLDKYIVAIYLSLGKYKILLFLHDWFK